MWNLGEYRKRPQRLTDYLPWAALIGPGVVLNKDGSFQKTVTFRGPDLDSSTPYELVAARARMNNVLRRLGSNWCVHVEASRRSAPAYPACEFPNGVAARRIICARPGAMLEKSMSVGSELVSISYSIFPS